MSSYSMQDRSNNEKIVYYVVAAVSIFVLISYGSTKDILPIFGFLITGMAVYILYPNETIALIMALIVSTILRRTRREGMTDEDEEDEEDEDGEGEDDGEAVKKESKSKKDKKDKKDKKGKKEKFTQPTPVPEKPKEKAKAAFTLNPANFNSSNAPSSNDMDKLSGMIDRTMKLVEMLPDGFLQNATNNNTL